MKTINVKTVKAATAVTARKYLTVEITEQARVLAIIPVDIKDTKVYEEDGVWYATATVVGKEV